MHFFFTLKYYKWENKEGNEPELDLLTDFSLDIFNNYIAFEIEHKDN